LKQNINIIANVLIALGYVTFGLSWLFLMQFTKAAESVTETNHPLTSFLASLEFASFSMHIWAVGFCLWFLLCFIGVITKVGYFIYYKDYRWYQWMIMVFGLIPTGLLFLYMTLLQIILA
jgi:hypothetical protein